MDKWFPVGLFSCVQYCCYLLFYIIRQICNAPWIHCKAVLLVNLSMLCRLDDLSDWKDKCKFSCSYSLAMAGWRRGPTKEKERITSPLLHQPKSMLWFRNIKGIALPFLYINLISMHQSIWSSTAGMDNSPMPVGCRWEGRGGMLISFTQIDWCIILSLFATQYLWYLWCKFGEFSMDQFLLPSAVCLILYWYSETKFCLGYSWEFKD